MFPSFVTASSGTDSAFGITAVSTAFEVVIPGRSVVSACSTVMWTSNTFASAFGRCSPTFATLTTLPVSFLVGSASRAICTGCPDASFRTSISLT
jgi:hypothetical protein